MLKIGDIVKHKLTKEICLVIQKGKEQFVIRTPSYKEVWVYDYEVVVVNDTETEN